MSKARLKKTLASMDKEDLINIITEAYDARKETKEYFEFWLNPDPKAEYEKVSQKIYKIFFNSDKRGRKRIKLSDASKILKDFRSICGETEYYAYLLADLALNYALWLSGRYFVRSHQATAIKYYRAALAGMEENYLESELHKTITRTHKILRKIYPSAII